jgi:hypothetical protein
MNPHLRFLFPPLIALGLYIEVNHILATRDTDYSGLAFLIPGLVGAILYAYFNQRHRASSGLGRTDLLAMITVVILAVTLGLLVFSYFLMPYLELSLGWILVYPILGVVCLVGLILASIMCFRRPLGRTST